MILSPETEKGRRGGPFPSGCQKTQFQYFFQGHVPWKKSLLSHKCAACGARRATAGKFSLNFAKFSENFPHVPLVGKARQGFFDRLTEKGRRGGPFPFDFDATRYCRVNGRGHIFSGAETPRIARPFSRTARTVSASFNLAFKSWGSAPFIRQAL